MKFSDDAQSKSLDNMAQEYHTSKALGSDRQQTEFIIDAVLPHCKGNRVLELGCGAGLWTRKLVDLGFDLTVVEGSSILAKRCRDNFENSVKVVNALFEEFVIEDTFQEIIASCVLEHVANPKLFLALLRSWVEPEGNIHIVVPNALSLHRRIGFKMGMLADPLQLSPQELKVGHRRSYTAEKLKSQLDESQLKVHFVKGVFLKPLSSIQMMDWPDALFKAYNEIGEELTEYCAFLYANCSK